MPIYLLDTNMATYIVTARSRLAQQRYTDRQNQDRIVISAITEGEIRYGMARRPADVRSLHFMQRFLNSVESLPWDSNVTRVYGDLRSQLASSGQTLGALDMLIAAHAIELGAVLVTHDQTFRRLHPHTVHVHDWATDL